VDYRSYKLSAGSISPTTSSLVGLSANPSQQVSLTGGHRKNTKEVNTSRPIPEATEGHNDPDYHCKNCNIHLHRHHFGDSPSDHKLAEAAFLNEGWQCEACDAIASWSTYNIKAAKKTTEQRLRGNMLWHVGSLNKEQIPMVETIMAGDE
jgi:hypothetical protein